MDLFEKFESSYAFDKVSRLPLCPNLNNPWIYTAYALRLMRGDGLTASQEALYRTRFKAHADACRIRFGLFDRFPGGRGGIFSHDELAGMAYCSPELARELILYLMQTDGIYCNKPEEMRPEFPDEFNVYRFLWLLPFMRSCAPGFDVGLGSRLSYALYLLLDGLSYKDGDESGRLKIWLTLSRMEGYFITGLAVMFWRSRMNKAGISPKSCFKKELPAYPIFADHAPESF